MSFLQPRQSLQGHQFKEQGDLNTNRPSSIISSTSAIENVPQKINRSRTTSGLGASRLIQQVSSIFAPKTRKKIPPDLKLVQSAFNSNLPNLHLRRASTSSSLDSEDDIRRPSDLGDAVSIRSLPPSPFTPVSTVGEYESPLDAFPIPPGGFVARSRTISTPTTPTSPSYIRTKAHKHKTRPRNGSTPRAPAPKPVIITPKSPFNLPPEIIALILSKLPQRDVTVCAVLSRAFASAARVALYSHLDFDELSPAQSEKLVALLGSRRDLTDIVTTFICRKWPAFFPPTYNINGQTRTHSGNGHVMKDQDALLTATFTLALERMPNLQSLTLPSFNASLLAYHTAFGLKSVKFVFPMTDSEIKALFTWLDGQINVTSLSLKDADETTSKPNKLAVVQDRNRPGTAPPSPLLRALAPNANGISPFSSPASSPRATFFTPQQSLPSSADLSSTSTLLPNLTILHTTPTIWGLLSPPSSSTHRRPLRKVTLDINTTLYNGLRPVSLMNSLRGIAHLTLRFSENVDKRTLEKMLGAVAASLGDHSKSISDEFSSSSSSSSADNASNKGYLSEWSGLNSLEIALVSPSGQKPGSRDEALYCLYKSLQGSLARYKSLSSLRLRLASFDESEHYRRHHYPEEDKQQNLQPSPSEQIMIDCWTKMCPTLGSVILFSGARWRGKPLPSLPSSSNNNSQKLNALGGIKVFKFP
ncbi:hypothetical protein CPC08DRAFT_818179 [Agrocybe pediades]|nr:hypothetical protein CPC08DRAFT_818179 [Agrocybe pediades]